MMMRLRVQLGFPREVMSCLALSAASRWTSTSTLAYSTKAAGWTVDLNRGIVSFQQKPLYQVIVGLEIHVQLNTPYKLFSPATSSFNNNPNSSFHPFDAAVPGFLPVLSHPEVVETAIRAALCLNCDVQPISRFERKHYAYADLPAGYQITQQRWPLAKNGHVPVVTVTNHETKKNQDHDVNQATTLCRIERLQLEQDTAKTTTQQQQQVVYSPCIDLDRAGVALIEIVTAPDLRSPIQARCTAQHIHELLTTTGVTQGRMELGEMRFDVNVNLEELNCDPTASSSSTPRKQKQKRSVKRRSGRVEVKNLNSFHQVQAAVLYEAQRQAPLFYLEQQQRTQEHEEGEHDLNGVVGGGETRTWNAVTHQTVLIRKKDTAQDYRFMPDPDLPPLVLQLEENPQEQQDQYFGRRTILKSVAEIRKNLPELPAQTRQRLVQQYPGISDYQAQVLVGGGGNSRFVALFEQVMKKLQQTEEEEEKSPQKEKRTIQAAKLTANLICNDLFALLKTAEATEVTSSSPVTPSDTTTPTTSSSNNSISIDRVITPMQLAEIVSMLQEEVISSPMAKKLLALIVQQQHKQLPDKREINPSHSLSFESPRRLAAEKGWQLLTHMDALRRVCRQVLEQHPDKVKLYRDQQVTNLKKLFLGKAMSATGGNAHPQRLQEALQQVLDNDNKE